MDSKFHIIREEFSSSSERESREACIASKNTSGVAIAHVCGIKVIDFSRTIEDSPTGTKTVAAWAVADDTVTIDGEKITTGELLHRARDDEWQAAHPDSKITYMALCLRANHSLSKAIGEKKPLVSFKRGKFQALLTVGGDKEKQHRLLTKAGFNPAEISEILTSL